MAVNKNMHGSNSPVYGKGVQGQAFHSKQAWLASRAHALALDSKTHTTGGPGKAPLPTDAGWGGMDGVIKGLSGELTQQQMTNMQAGVTGAGGTGSIGGMHGAMGGLSSKAMEWLANSGLLEKNAGAAAVDTTGLTGTDLLLAQIHNTLNSEAAPSYSLAKGVTADSLQGLLKQAMTQGGGNIFAKGYTAAGPAQPGPHLPAPVAPTPGNPNPEQPG